VVAIGLRADGAAETSHAAQLSVVRVDEPARVVEQLPHGDPLAVGQKADEPLFDAVVQPQPPLLHRPEDERGRQSLLKQ
jgi:hypothetical protein